MSWPVPLGPGRPNAVPDGPAPVRQIPIPDPHIMELLMTMSQAALCDDVVRLLQNEGTSETTLGIEFLMEAKALSSYVKTHRINTRDLNVIDVIHILWPPFEDAGRPGMTTKELNDMLESNPPRFTLRKSNVDSRSVEIDSRAYSDVHRRDLIANMVVYDITFPDESRGMVIVENGIGVEFLVVDLND